MSDIDCTLPENEMMGMCMDEHIDYEGNKMRMRMANFQYTVTALWAAFFYLSKQFHYRSDSMRYYSSGDLFLGTDVPNYWKMANSLRMSGGGAIFSILFFTQLLSLFGVLGEINLMAWRVLLPVWTINNMVAHAIAFLGYEAAYS